MTVAALVSRARTAHSDHSSVRRRGRVDAKARRRPEGFGHAHPGPRRHPRPDRFVPVRGARPVRLPGRPRAAGAAAVTAPGPVRVALLGSTGSIGRQTLDVLTSAGPDAFRVVAMAAGRDAATFAG